MSDNFDTLDKLTKPKVRATTAEYNERIRLRAVSMIRAMALSDDAKERMLIQEALDTVTCFLYIMIRHINCEHSEEFDVIFNYIIKGVEQNYDDYLKRKVKNDY